MRIVILIFFQMLFAIVSSQNVIWASQYCGLNSGSGISIAADASGNVYSTGSFKDSIDLDPGPLTTFKKSKGLNDIYITKTDNNGNLIWAAAVGGAPMDYSFDLTLDSRKNVLVTGSFIGTADFDPGPSVYNLTATAFEDVFVLKLDSMGNFVWAIKMSSPTGAETGIDLATDVADDIYLAGNFSDTLDVDPGIGTYSLVSHGGYDAFVCKLTSAGNFVWASNVGGSIDDYSESLSLDVSGNIFFGGSFKGTADLDPGPAILNHTSAGQSDVFILKLTNSGNLIWAKRFGGSSFDYVHTVANDASGNCFVSGEFYSTIDLDPGVGTYSVTALGGTDGYVQKLDAAGNFVWGRRFGGNLNEITYSMAVDAGGEVYLGGGYMASGDFDPGPGIYTLTNMGTYDIFLLKLDASANFSWAHSIGSSNGEFAYGVCLDPANNVFVTGYFELSPDFDPSAGTNILSSCGVNDPYVYKVDNPLTTGINVNDETTVFSVFPNPASDLITISDHKKNKTNYKIISVSGKTVITGETDLQQKIDVSDLPAGMYFIEISDNENRAVKKIIKN